MAILRTSILNLEGNKTELPTTKPAKATSETLPTPSTPGNWKADQNRLQDQNINGKL